jgi:hypothetical protein
MAEYLRTRVQFPPPPPISKNRQSPIKRAAGFFMPLEWPLSPDHCLCAVTSYASHELCGFQKLQFLNSVLVVQLRINQGNNWQQSAGLFYAMLSIEDEFRTFRTLASELFLKSYSALHESSRYFHKHWTVFRQSGFVSRIA